MQILFYQALNINKILKEKKIPHFNGDHYHWRNLFTKFIS